MFALLVVQPDLRIAFAQLVYVDKTFHFIQGNKKSKLICQKWRNFDKISLKAFNQIEAKKMKELLNTFWADFRRTCFAKNVNKSLFRFPKEYSNLFELFFVVKTLFQRIVVKALDTSIRNLFEQNSRSETYSSGIYTNLALLYL